MPDNRSRNLLAPETDRASMRAALVIALKVAALTVVHFVCFTIASALVFSEESVRQPSSEQTSTALALLAVSFLNTLVLSLIILRSRWAGWKLALAVALAFYGVMTVMGQIESLVFLTNLPAGTVPRLFLLGAIVAALFSPVAVIVLGKWKSPAAVGDASEAVRMSLAGWPWRLTLIVASYLVLYFTFGYFIAWRNPAVPVFYGEADPGSFFAQMGAVLRDTPWRVPLQIGRALLWAAIAFLVLLMMRGPWWSVALAVSFLFAVVMNAQLLLPNPYMPEEVRMAHLVETATSNFIFGMIVVWLLHPRESPAGASCVAAPIPS
jgi:hypothetical protein